MLNVRRASIADAARLAELGARTFHDTFAADNRPEDMAAYVSQTYGEAHQRAELVDPRHVALLVEEGESLIAFAQLRHDGDSLEIARFYVDRLWHGRGVAQTLMRAVLDLARELGKCCVWLAVWERNARAIAFYTRCGFLDIGTQPFLLGSDLQTDRVMAIELS
jgi:ribosomal protein S18 acetylase RimI-like enzyme